MKNEQNPAAVGRRRHGQVRLRLGLAGVAVLSLLLCPPQGRAEGDEGEVVTPRGDRVMVKHTILPSGVTDDFYEYVDHDGRRIKHGAFKRYNRNGVVREIRTYRHGQRHGRFVIRFENNLKQVEGQYAEDKLDGRVIRYYANGQVQVDAEYRAGELHGPFVRYFASGKPQERGVFVDGQREGLYTEYNEDGTPYLEATYRAGEMHGPATLHDEKGALAARGTLAADLIQGDWLCFDGGETPVSVRTDCDGRAYWECACP